jgi:hypothetical protein
VRWERAKQRGSIVTPGIQGFEITREGRIKSPLGLHDAFTKMQRELCCDPFIYSYLYCALCPR